MIVSAALGFFAAMSLIAFGSHATYGDTKHAAYSMFYAVVFVVLFVLHVTGAVN